MTALITAALALTIAHVADAGVPQRTPGDAVAQVGAGLGVGGALTPAQRSRRDAVVANLQAGLAGTPMAGSVRQLEQAARKWGIHPAFIAAVAGVESSYGRFACRNDRRNVYGLASCRSYYWAGCRAFGIPLRIFRSWADSYLYFARFIARCWPRVNSPASIGFSYCPPCGSRWGESVSWHMRRLGYAPRVRYVG